MSFEINSSTQSKLSSKLISRLSIWKGLSTSRMWDQPISQCKKIVENLEDVDRVYTIIEFEKEHNNSVISENPKVFGYNSVLARTYCLLYYKYSKDTIIKTAVLPALKNEIGPFGKEWFDAMVGVLDGIISVEAELEVAKEKAKNKTPLLFECPKFPSMGELDTIFIEFNKEPLFRAMKPIIDYYKNIYKIYHDETLLWMTAKKFVRVLWIIDYPENYLNRIENSIVSNNYIGHNDGIVKVINYCMLAIMMATTDERNHFGKFIDEVLRVNKFSDIRLTINEAFRNNNIIKSDFYIQEHSDAQNGMGNTTALKKAYEDALTKQTEESQKEIRKLKEDNDRLTKELSTATAKYEAEKKDKQDLEAELTSIKGQETVIETDDQTVIDPSNTQRLELLIQFFEKMEVDLKKRGNQSTCARIMDFITGIGFDSCNVHFSYRKNHDAGSDPTKEIERSKVNGWLQKIGLDCHL